MYLSNIQVNIGLYLYCWQDYITYIILTEITICTRNYHEVMV